MQGYVVLRSHLSSSRNISPSSIAKRRTKTQNRLPIVAFATKWSCELIKLAETCARICMQLPSRFPSPEGQDGKVRPLFRKPRRITITIPDQAYRSLLERSNRQGRSISNLAAFLLERAIASQ